MYTLKSIMNNFLKHHYKDIIETLKIYEDENIDIASDEAVSIRYSLGMTIEGTEEEEGSEEEGADTADAADASRRRSRCSRSAGEKFLCSRFSRRKSRSADAAGEEPPAEEKKTMGIYCYTMINDESTTDISGGIIDQGAEKAFIRFKSNKGKYAWGRNWILDGLKPFPRKQLIMNIFFMGEYIGSLIIKYILGKDKIKPSESTYIEWLNTINSNEVEKETLYTNLKKLYQNIATAYFNDKLSLLRNRCHSSRKKFSNYN